MRADSVGFIGQKVSKIKVSDIRRIIIEAFQSQFESTRTINWTKQNNNFEELNNFNDNLQLLKSEDWIYNKTPKFDFLFVCPNEQKKFRICVEKGIVQKSDHDAFLINQSFYQSYLHL